MLKQMGASLLPVEMFFRRWYANIILLGLLAWDYRRPIITYGILSVIMFTLGYYLTYIAGHLMVAYGVQRNW